MASTVLPNGIIVPEKFSRDWYADLYHNWQELDNLLGGGTPKDGTLTIQKNGDTVGTFSANQETDETINITVPDVNNGTLTIQQNGTTVDTFTANSSSDKTVNIECVDLTNNQTVAGNKEFTGTTTAHDVIPSATDTYNLGSSTAQWNNAYIKSLTINGTQFVPSNYMTLNTIQTVASAKYYTGYQDINPYRLRIKNPAQEKGVIPASNLWNGFVFCDKNNESMFSIEQGMMPNGVIQLNFSGRANDNDTTYTTFLRYINNSDLTTNCVNIIDLMPFGNRTRKLGDTNSKWKSFNGINPGALSLPGAFVNVDTTNWDLTCSNGQLGSFTPTADGWLMLHIVNSGTSEVNFWIIGGEVRINNKSSANFSNNDNSNMFTIPVTKDKTYNIYSNASEYVAGRRISYCRFMPCQGNV